MAHKFISIAMLIVLALASLGVSATNKSASPAERCEQDDLEYDYLTTSIDFGLNYQAMTANRSEAMDLEQERKLGHHCLNLGKFYIRLKDFHRESIYFIKNCRKSSETELLSQLNELFALTYELEGYCGTRSYIFEKTRVLNRIEFGDNQAFSRKMTEVDDAFKTFSKNPALFPKAAE